MDDTFVQMRSRIRRHQVTSVVGALAVPLLALLAGALVPSLQAGPAPLVLLLVAGVAIVAIGSSSARVNLRCPACGHSVSRVVARAFSGIRNEGKCPGCGVRLFADA